MVKKFDFFEFKMSNYAEECLKKYVKIRETLQVQIRFKIYPTQILVYYYYDNMTIKSILIYYGLLEIYTNI